jgi:phosphopantothenoylcysteine decarboxylase / phosphopantothenate---cysteine ligase
MRILITAGPTHEPIDPVRFIGNRSSGRMGAALAESAINSGHKTTLILGPISVPFPKNANRIDIETADQMLTAVLREFPQHDLLIMAAAVSDFRPKTKLPTKTQRQGILELELEPTQDVIAAAGKIKRPDQRTVGFSLESSPDLDRVHRKLIEKNLDLIVFNPMATIASESIDATLLYPDNRREKIPATSKSQFANQLLERAIALFKPT